MNINSLIQAANDLVVLDETELALKVLECLPGHLRDNIPKEISDLKNLILNKILMHYDYLKDNRELPKDLDYCKNFLNNTQRGCQLKHFVKTLNEQGTVPHIVDMGPGDFCFPIGMHAEGLNFTYDCFTLNLQAKEECKKLLGSMFKEWYSDKSTNIFVAYEIIEHLSNIQEIRQCFSRYFPKPADYVLLSTPRYTFDIGTYNWKEIGIHHLRTYTPTEFMLAGLKLFPEYKFTYVDDPVMVLAGHLNSR